MLRHNEIESLESRRVMSVTGSLVPPFTAAMTSKGTLIVQGTAAAEAIDVSRVGGLVQVTGTSADGYKASVSFKVADV